MEKLRKLLNPECTFFHDEILGMLIKLPLGTAKNDVEIYAALLLRAGVDVTIQPESSYNPPKLKIKGEALGSLDSKLAGIEPIPSVATTRL